jgi:hypothetical protein
MRVRRPLHQGERNSIYIDCGLTLTGSLAANEYEITFTIAARVSPGQLGGTAVGVLIDGTARNQGARTRPVFCTGTGRLEDEFLRRVEAHVAARGA